MKNIKVYVNKLNRYLDNESKEGKNLIKIKQQKKGNKTYFNIHPVYLNNAIHSINVEKSTLRGDTILPISAFEVVIKALLKQDENILPKGNAQKRKIKIGDQELEIYTLESIIAIEIYKKNIGESTYRRIPVISNILVQAGICENIRDGSKLKLIKI